jgi:hypothetical protein
MKRLLTSGGVFVAALAAPAAAQACDYGSTSRVFGEFGDSADYYLAPGGDFESLSWTSWNGPRLVWGVNPFALAGGNRSLELEPDEGVRSPLLCVSRDTPHLRFVAKGAGDKLYVEVRVWKNGRVADYSREGISSADHRVWRPSRNIDLKSSEIPHGQTGLVTVNFETDAGDWLIDDVFIDPYRR